MGVDYEDGISFRWSGLVHAPSLVATRPSNLVQVSPQGISAGELLDQDLAYVEGPLVIEFDMSDFYETQRITGYSLRFSFTPGPYGEGNPARPEVPPAYALAQLQHGPWRSGLLGYLVVREHRVKLRASAPDGDTAVVAGPPLFEGPNSAHLWAEDGVVTAEYNLRVMKVEAGPWRVLPDSPLILQFGSRQTDAGPEMPWFGSQIRDVRLDVEVE
jgi:hypothetical protein